MTNVEIERLDEVIERLVVNPEFRFKLTDPGDSNEDEVAALARTAGELRYVARPEFKARLRSELQWRAAAVAAQQGNTRHASCDIPSSTQRRMGHPESNDGTPVLPTLFGEGYGAYPIHRGNFVASFVLHAAALAFVVTSGIWVVQHREALKQQVTTVFVEPSPYALSPSPTEAGGGGGGGDRDKLEASKGSAPRFSREQLAPPVVVLRNAEPKLAVEATVVGPPSLVLPQSGQTGDSMGSILTASNGPGFGGGIGDGEGGGVGSGRGPGVGLGWGGGIGGGIYRVGGGVSAPRALFDPDPEYSEEARKAKYQGTVVLWVVVGPDGRARDIRVQRSLGMGLDEKAVEAVRKWRFDPGKKDGRPVAVQVNVEVNFRLY